MASRRPGTSAPLTGRAVAGGGRVKRVEKLLAGELLDTSRLAYDFDVDHVALIGVGNGAEEEIGRRVSTAGLPELVVRAGGGAVWAWVGSRDGVDSVARQARSHSHSKAEWRIAIGEPGHGLGGWRLSHQQARAALAVGVMSGELVVRYADVALLASLVRDDLLASSLRRLYLEPLEESRGGGEELRGTLRAYFEADRNVSVAGTAIGVTRQAVARRLRLAEELIGRPLGSCSAELELALRFEALEPTPPSAP